MLTPEGSTHVLDDPGSTVDPICEVLGHPELGLDARPAAHLGVPLGPAPPQATAHVDDHRTPELPASPHLEIGASRFVAYISSDMPPPLLAPPDLGLATPPPPTRRTNRRLADKPPPSLSTIERARVVLRKKWGIPEDGDAEASEDALL